MHAGSRLSPLLVYAKDTFLVRLKANLKRYFIATFIYNERSKYEIKEVIIIVLLPLKLVINLAGMVKSLAGRVW